MASKAQRQTVVKLGKPYWVGRSTSYRAVGAPEDRTFQFLASDDSVDRMGDTIAVDGWDCKDFIRNPVILFVHNNQTYPVGQGLRVWADEKGLHSLVKISDITEVDKIVFAKLCNGDLRAVSVGFKPLEMEWVEREDEDGNLSAGIDFKRQELLEISICPVPANANALAEARTKSMGVRKDEEMAMGAEQVKTLGEHVKAFGEHMKELGDHVKALKEYVSGDDATTGNDKAFLGTLKALGLTEAQIAAVVRAADQAHAMHPDVLKCVGAAHKSLTKALNLHNGAASAGSEPPKPGGDGKPGAKSSDDDDEDDEDDKKAFEQLAATQKLLEQAITKLTGKVA